MRRSCVNVYVLKWSASRHIVDILNPKPFLLVAKYRMGAINIAQLLQK